MDPTSKGVPLGMQAFSAWIHICAVRLFVESILRYGLPPKFLAALMKPHQKTAPKLRKLLAQLFGSQGDLALLRLRCCMLARNETFLAWGHNRPCSFGTEYCDDAIRLSMASKVCTMSFHIKASDQQQPELSAQAHATLPCAQAPTSTLMGREARARRRCSHMCLSASLLMGSCLHLILGSCQLEHRVQAAKRLDLSVLSLACGAMRTACKRSSYVAHLKPDASRTT